MTTISWNQIAVYDSAGTLINLLGSPGTGPGEFIRAEHLTVSQGDSLYVVDNRRARITVLDPDFAVVRSVPINASAQVRAIVPLADGRVVVSQDVPSPDLAGLPLHTVGVDGVRAVSYGIDAPEIDPGSLGSISYRRVALSPGDSAVWVAPYDRYDLQKWGVQGNRMSAFYRPMNALLMRQGRADLRTGGLLYAMSGVAVDSIGRVWSLVSIRMKNPPPLIKADTTGGEQRPMRRIVQPRRSDSMIDILDPGTGQLVATQIVAPLLTGGIRAGLYYSRLTDSVGVVSFEVWRARLVNSQ